MGKVLYSSKVRMLGISLKVDPSRLDVTPICILGAPEAIIYRDTNLLGIKTYLRIAGDQCQLSSHRGSMAFYQVKVKLPV